MKWFAVLTRQVGIACGVFGAVVSLSCHWSALAEAPSSGAVAVPHAAAAATVATVDRLLREEIAGDAKSPVAPRVDDETFLRRVSLDLVGYPATPGQIVAFALDTDPQKRAKLVDRLLADPRFGENWAHYWRDVIFYRRTEERALLGAEACVEFLTEQINNNTPWDKVATASHHCQGRRA